MTAEQLWAEFLAHTGEKNQPYEAWQFGDAPDELAELVLIGKKVGTASAYPLYELENEPIPQAGAYSVILDSKDRAVCVIRTTKVYVTAFRDVSAEHAAKEGEGDQTLAYWRRIHEAFFRKELQGVGLRFDENLPIVCEEFERVYPV